MNYLAHLYLSGDDAETLVGNFMGDFVKGRLNHEFPPGIAEGIMLHRRIDSFVQPHPVFSRSRRSLSSRYGHYRGVMIDLFYDHFLAKEWPMYSNEPFDQYLQRVRRMIELHGEWLPERLKGLLTVIFEELLPSYRYTTEIGRALVRMSQRVRRPNPLAGGEEQLVRHYESLRDDFRLLLPDLCTFSSRVRDENRGIILNRY